MDSLGDAHAEDFMVWSETAKVMRSMCPNNPRYTGMNGVMNVYYDEMYELEREGNKMDRAEARFIKSSKQRQSRKYNKASAAEQSQSKEYSKASAAWAAVAGKKDSNSTNGSSRSSTTQSKTASNNTKNKVWSSRPSKATASFIKSTEYAAQQAMKPKASTSKSAKSKSYIAGGSVQPLKASSKSTAPVNTTTSIVNAVSGNKSRSFKSALPTSSNNNSTKCTVSLASLYKEISKQTALVEARENLRCLKETQAKQQAQLASLLSQHKQNVHERRSRKRKNWHLNQQMMFKKNKNEQPAEYSSECVHSLENVEKEMKAKQQSQLASLQSQHKQNAHGKRSRNRKRKNEQLKQNMLYNYKDDRNEQPADYSSECEHGLENLEKFGI